jgi:3-oxoacyl-[acyl-carrier protein] reductase
VSERSERTNVTLPQFRLDGRVGVVTGAASGIGRATATVLSDAGARLVLADLDEAGLERTATMVAESVVVPTDVSRKADVEALVARAVTHFGQLDVMANIAGIINGGPITSVDEADLDRILAVNLKGVFFGCQAALRVMGEHGSGSIVNMASTAIDQPAAGLAAYSIAKAGVAMLTRVAAQEGGPLGVRVNAVAPGFVVTPMTQRDDLEQMESMVKAMRARSPLKAVGEPEDIANAVLYLASDASRFVTGEILRANGGVAMPG